MNKNLKTYYKRGEIAFNKSGSNRGIVQEFNHN